MCLPRRPLDQPRTQGGRLRILVVEDDKKVASFLERGLREEGYSVGVAHDGTDGLLNPPTPGRPPPWPAGRAGIGRSGSPVALLENVSYAPNRVDEWVIAGLAKLPPQMPHMYVDHVTHRIKM